MSNSKVIRIEDYFPKSKFELPTQREVDALEELQRRTKEELKRDIQKRLYASFFIKQLISDDISILSEAFFEEEKFTIEELKNINKTTESNLAIFRCIVGVS